MCAPEGGAQGWAQGGCLVGGWVVCWWVFKKTVGGWVWARGSVRPPLGALCGLAPGHSSQASRRLAPAALVALAQAVILGSSVPLNTSTLLPPASPSSPASSSWGDGASPKRGDPPADPAGGVAGVHVSAIRGPCCKL